MLFTHIPVVVIEHYPGHEPRVVDLFMNKVLADLDVAKNMQFTPSDLYYTVHPFTIKLCARLVLSIIYTKVRRILWKAH